MARIFIDMFFQFYHFSSVKVSPDRPNFEETCDSDVNYYGLFYNAISLVIGIAISSVIIKIYKTRAHPLDERFNHNFKETAKDLEKLKLKKQEKEQKKKNGKNIQDQDEFDVLNDSD